MDERHKQRLDEARRLLVAGTPLRKTANLSGIAMRELAVLIKWEVLPRSGNPEHGLEKEYDFDDAEFARLVIAGYTNQEIADALGIGRGSVTWYIKHRRPDLLGLRKPGPK